MLDHTLTVQVAYAVWHQLLSEAYSWQSPISAADGLTWGSFAVAKMLTRPNPGKLYARLLSSPACGIGLLLQTTQHPNVLSSSLQVIQNHVLQLRILKSLQSWRCIRRVSQPAHPKQLQTRRQCQAGKSFKAASMGLLMKPGKQHLLICSHLNLCSPQSSQAQQCSSSSCSASLR